MEYFMVEIASSRSCSRAFLLLMPTLWRSSSFMMFPFLRIYAKELVLGRIKVGMKFELTLLTGGDLGGWSSFLEASFLVSENT